MTDSIFTAANTALALPPFNAGEVWLVGTGPGDPGLLTLHAVNALRQADVILYDALVDEAILALARPQTLREFAGKRGGKPSHSQNDITERMIELARQGHRVLRLKGGDPFVFGRGGEEALGLVAAGISFRVVPGVTAGLAGLAYAAIPATTRDTNRGVILVTGHTAEGNDHSIDWAAIAHTKLPIIIYMGMTRLADITAALISAALPSELPAAVVMHASLPQQRVLVSTLGQLAADAAAQGFASPSIVAIGDMVRLREALVSYSLTLRTES